MCSQPTKHRYFQIDYAKALWIILVVLGHATNEVSRKGIDIGLYDQIHNWIYCFHMPLFFILSGLGIYFKYLNNQSIVFFKELKNISKNY